MKNEFDLIKTDIQQRIRSGSIKPDTNGLYKIGYYINGWDERIFVRGRNSAEIAHKIIERRDALVAKKEVKESLDMRFDAVVNRWFDSDIKGRGLSENNIKNTKSLVNKHILCDEFGKRRINGFTHLELQNFLNDKGKVYSFSHVLKIKNTLEAIFKFAQIEGLLTVNPAFGLKMPKCVVCESDLKDPVTVEELALALSCVKNDLQLKIILMMLFLYGMRTVELVNLKWEDISFDENYILISKSKYTDAITTRNREITQRYLPLSELIVDDLKELKKKETGVYADSFIFRKRTNGSPLNTRSLDCYFRTMHRDEEIACGAELLNNKIVNPVGIRRFVPYAFRHGVATRFNALNFNDALSQLFLGHKPKSVKDKFYSKLDFDQHLRGAYQPYMNAVEHDLKVCLKQAYGN